MLGVALGTILLPACPKLRTDDRGEGILIAARLGPAARPHAAFPPPWRCNTCDSTRFDAVSLWRVRAADVMHTRDALIAYSIGLTGLIIVKVLAPGFYARQDIRTR